MSFQREAASLALFDEIFPLLELHYSEISANLDIPLEPDFEMYLKLDQMNMIRVFTSRDDANALIGYAVFFVRHNSHYKSSLQAVQDVLFIHPNRRGNGGRFIKWCDDQLRSEGVQVSYHHIKADHNFGPLLERLGYKLVDLIYSHRLDKPNSKGVE